MSNNFEAVLYDREGLIPAFQRGDKPAFMLVYANQVGKLAEFIQSLVRDVPTVENICQECFYRLYHNRQEMKSMEQIKNFLFLTARNEVFQLLGKKATDEGPGEQKQKGDRQGFEKNAFQPLRFNGIKTVQDLLDRSS